MNHTQTKKELFSLHVLRLKCTSWETAAELLTLKMKRKLYMGLSSPGLST